MIDVGGRRESVYGPAMLLEGSCHCGLVRFSAESTEPYPYMRCYCSICVKTSGGGGFAINLAADAQTMKIDGKEHIRVYRAMLERDGTRAPSKHARSFCAVCGSHVWALHDDWPDHLHPVASAIDTPLPAPPKNTHIMLGSKPTWVPVEGTDQDERFEAYPDKSIRAWHEAQGLVVD